MRVWGVALALAAIGCGRLGFDETGGGAAADGLPRAVPNLVAPSATEGHPTVSPDLLELYFTSTRDGGSLDVWRATRETPEDAWSAPERVSELNTAMNEETVDLSDDGLAIWIASNRPGLGGNDLWLATRSELGGRWSTPVLVDRLASPQRDEAAAPSADGLSIIFHSERAGGFGRRDLWMATRARTDLVWQSPVPIGELNTTFDDADPFVTRDGLQLMFDSDRKGHGHRELFVTSRNSPTSPFRVPVAMIDLQSDHADADPWLSADGTYMVFTSSRTGDDEIFEVRFPEPRL